MIPIRTIALVLLGSVFVAGFLPSETYASDEKKALERKLIMECKKKLKPDIEDCKALDEEEQDPESYILESCTQDAIKYYDKCVKDAKKKADSTSFNQSEKEKKRAEKLKLLTF